MGRGFRADRVGQGCHGHVRAYLPALRYRSKSSRGMQLMTLSFSTQARLPGPAGDCPVPPPPGTPRLGDAVLYEGEGALVVGVGVYGDPDACLHRLADVGDGEVEAVGVGVQLEDGVGG